MRLFFVIISLFVVSQGYAADVCVQSYSEESKISWSVSNSAGHIVYCSDDYSDHSACTMSLQDNHSYFWDIHVEYVDINDTVLMTLALDGNVIMAIPNSIELGDHHTSFTAGMSQPVMKIVGGTNAKIEDFPWQVFFRFGDYVCGGTIIAERWILTAAHCTQDDNGQRVDASEMFVLAGTNNISNRTGKRYAVKDYVIHEEFSRFSLNNDIAVLELEEPIDISSASIISLISSKDVAGGATAPGVMGTIAGWGFTDPEAQTLSSILQKVDLPIVANNVAGQVWGAMEYNKLAAGYKNGNKDACSGDSGGPLIVDVAGDKKIAGIVSFGSENCNTYGGYTRVSSYLSWIEKHTSIVPLGELAFLSGELEVCFGTKQSTYVVSNGNTNYVWRLSPAEAGELEYSGNEASIIWNETFIGDVTLRVKAMIQDEESQWKEIRPRVVPLTQVMGISADSIICESETIRLQVDAVGDDLVYDWYKDDVFYTTTYQSYLTLIGVDTLSSGAYKCLVKGTCGEMMSSSMQLTVIPTTQVYDQSSYDIDITQGDNAQLSVSAVGHQVTYQWYKDDVAIDGATASTYEIWDVNALDIGNYYAVVKGRCQSDESEAIYLYVDDKSLMYNARIWPTVCTDVLHVAISTNFLFNLSIFDVNGGKKIAKRALKNQLELDVSDLPLGVYFIQIESQSLNEVFRFIKQ